VTLSNQPLVASARSFQKNLHPSITAGLFNQAGVLETMPESFTRGVPGEALDSAVASIREEAEAITVKIFAGDSQGSGTIIQRSGTTYRVITNEHVLKSSTKVRVQTEDGSIYQASRDWGVKFQSNDLAIVEFRSITPYQVARIGSSFSLHQGEVMFAAGYPYTDNIANRPAFMFTEGQVAFLSDKAFIGGYQLGYSNKVRKGMSGGPVLNNQGELVAINGMHAQPLWGNPYIFQDGSQPPFLRFPVLSSS
jgi:S1-C subfamily serine protease